MDLTIFADMDAPELRRYLQFLLRHYRQMDSFWYLYITERFDEATADRLNEQVWDRVAVWGPGILCGAFRSRSGVLGFCPGLALLALAPPGGLPD